MKSAVRSFVKPFLFSLLNEGSYQFFQYLSKRRDILNGVDDEKEIALLPHLIREGETVIDVGANFALYTYHLSRAVGKKGRVHAFEPVPFAYGVCKRLVEHFRLENVSLYQKGCGHANETVHFTVPLQAFGAVSAGQSHFATRNNELPGKDRHFRFKKWRTIPCEVVRLDEFLPALQNVSFIKTDIEGAEYYAFQGAEGLIARERPTVLCEINPFFLEGFQIRLEDLVGFFTRKGYGLYFYRDGEEPALQKVSVQEVRENNYLFVHPDRMDRLTDLPSYGRGGLTTGTAAEIKNRREAQ